MEIKKYDQTETYKQIIHPMIKELEKTCYQNGIPLFVACAISEDGKSTGYHYAHMGPTNLNMLLSDDKLAEFVRVIKGYKVIPPEDQAEILFDITE